MLSQVGAGFQKDGSMAEFQTRHFNTRLGFKASWLAYPARDLGYFDDEHLDVALLHKQEIKDREAVRWRPEAQVDWFQHAVFGLVNGKPKLAVMVLYGAPWTSAMVSIHVKDEIRTAADISAKCDAEGASHSAKGVAEGVMTSYLAYRDGLLSGSCTPLFPLIKGQLQVVTAALQRWRRRGTDLHGAHGGSPEGGGGRFSLVRPQDARNHTLHPSFRLAGGVRLGERGVREGAPRRRPGTGQRHVAHHGLSHLPHPGGRSRVSANRVLGREIPCQWTGHHFQSPAGIDLRLLFHPT